MSDWTVVTVESWRGLRIDSSAEISEDDADASSFFNDSKAAMVKFYTSFLSNKQHTCKLSRNNIKTIELCSFTSS